MLISTGHWILEKQWNQTSDHQTHFSGAFEGMVLDYGYAEIDGYNEDDKDVNVFFRVEETQFYEDA